MNKYAIVLLLVVGSFIAGYFYKDEKIITKVETKYIKVQGKTVVVTKPDGSSVSTTDFVSNTTANTKEKTVINPKHLTVTGLYIPSKNSHSFGGILTYDFLDRVGLGGGAIRANNQTLGLIAVSFKF